MRAFRNAINGNVNVRCAPEELADAKRTASAIAVGQAVVCSEISPNLREVSFEPVQGISPLIMFAGNNDQTLVQ